MLVIEVGKMVGIWIGGGDDRDGDGGNGIADGRVF